VSLMTDRPRGSQGRPPTDASSAGERRLTGTMRPQYPASIGIGIDLASVGAVQESIETHGESYLRRVFTDEELEDCRSDPSRLAARFAAKEATIKALRPEDEPLPWKSIAVRRDTHGRPTLELRGEAAALARHRGVTELSISLAHEGPFAAAIVVAKLGGLA
jgi:holo-[acyl-carrier protein] synthase